MVAPAPQPSSFIFLPTLPSLRHKSWLGLDFHWFLKLTNELTQGMFYNAGKCEVKEKQKKEGKGTGSSNSAGSADLKEQTSELTHYLDWVWFWWGHSFQMDRARLPRQFEVIVIKYFHEVKTTLALTWGARIFHAIAI